LLAGDDGLADQLTHGVADLAKVFSVHPAMVTPPAQREAAGSVGAVQKRPENLLRSTSGSALWIRR
jgi:hypothetical protein